MALTDKLTAIGNAIRDKTGSTDLLTLDAMPTAISGITTGSGGGGNLNDYIPESALTITGDCTNRFANRGWDWFIEKYGDKITTNNISNMKGMFSRTSVKEIPFEINIGDVYTLEAMFDGAWYIRELPIINIPETPAWTTASYSSFQYMFRDCHSLRRIDSAILRNLYCKNTSSSIKISQVFSYCASLDEINGLATGIGNVKTTTNGFTNTFIHCNRLKNMTFATQEDGTPYSVNWKSQTIDLANCVGYTQNVNNITSYNSGITADKEVTDDATYQALKDDPDWFTEDVSYSRYNHDSAVATINSLPDTSAYLASAGGTNTIKFNGASGSATDGGAINTLTAEEIAVATAKGWTVSLV